MQRSGDHRRTAIMVIGNSLLLEGVNFPQLQQSVGPGYELRRLAVENTAYLDWYYGLRHIFRIGSRPDVVALFLNPIQLTSATMNGDYTVHLLVDREDLVSLARDIGADRNRLSSMVLANLSFSYGGRAEMRTWILDRILPGLHRLFRSSPRPQSYNFGDLVTRRLGQLRDLCVQNGTELVLVLPPARLDNGSGSVLRAAAAQHVKALVPIAPGVLPASDYSDNFHLNSQGARKFTPLLAEGLRQVVAPTVAQETHGVPSLFGKDQGSINAVDAASFGHSVARIPR